MQKKVLAWVLVAMLCVGVCMPILGEAAGPIRLWMDGDYVNTDVAPLIKNDRTLVPIRFVAENLGFDVAWDQEAKTVTIKSENAATPETITLTIGDTKLVSASGTKDMVMDVAPEIIQDRTMVPVRFVAEVFGIKVDWDNDNRVVIFGTGYDKKAPETAKVQLPFEGTKTLTFSSGAGGWATELTLSPDGKFTGKYYDSNGVDGTVEKQADREMYICHFSGQFTNIRQTDENTYMMDLNGYDQEETPDKVWYENRVRYIGATAYGLEGGKSFAFYTPGKPLATMSEEFIGWGYVHTQDKAVLNTYALHNLEKEEAFFELTEMD